MAMVAERLKRSKRVTELTAIIAVGSALILLATFVLASHATPGGTNTPATGNTAAAQRPATSVELSPEQVKAIKIARVGSYLFPVEKETVGSISFADHLSVQVFPSYQGKILKSLVELGDEVQKGQPLYTIESPDLIQAESNLIGAAATLELTNKELARAKDLNRTNGVSERELKQATSDQQTAEGALKAARDAVRVFGKTDAEIDQM